MAKTKQDLTDIISRKLFPYHFDDLVFNDLAQSVGSLSAEKKAILLDLVLTKQYEKIGQFLYQTMVTLAEANSDAEATTMLLDDNISLIELERIFD